MTRRIAAVVFLMLLVLNLAPRDVECMEHPDHEPETVTAVTGGSTAHSGHDDDAARDKPTPCDSTDESDCCQAVESCSTTHAIRPSQTTASAPSAFRSVTVFGARAPAYLIRPPEPPPPKA